MYMRHVISINRYGGRCLPPLQRAVLFEMKDERFGKNIRERFGPFPKSIEVWFESSNQDILACRYTDVRKYCGTYVYDNTIYRRHVNTWKVEYGLSNLCSE